MRPLNKGNFKKGNKPWNKDKKGIHLSPDSEFKAGEGHSMENHPSWNGGVQNMTVDCVHLNTGNKTRVRRPRQKYEDAYGKIPKGYIILHLDGDNKNDSIENLRAISRAELLKLNQG